MVVRILEAVFGLLASLYGFWMAVIEGQQEASAVNGIASPFAIVILFGMPLLGIGLGVLVHLFTSFPFASRDAHLAGEWVARIFCGSRRSGCLLLST